MYPPLRATALLITINIGLRRNGDVPVSFLERKWFLEIEGFLQKGTCVSVSLKREIGQ